MARWLGISCIMIVLTASLAGCWNAKEIQDVDYLTALGIDYVDGRYVAYTQTLDFVNVAKQEGPKPAEKTSVWVGRVEGITLNDALFKLYNTSQQKVFWGHITALVFHERVFKHGLKEAYDLVKRYREIRTNIWVYGTKTSIEQLFSVTPFFKLSPLSSILHEPSEIYKQSSLIPPLYFYRMVSDLNNPSVPARIPSLSINETAWKENLKNHALLEVNGIFLLDEDRYLGWLGRKDLRGMRWMSNQTVRSNVTVMKSGEPAAGLVLENPKSRISYHMSGGHTVFDVHVYVTGGVNDVLQDVTQQELESKANEILEQEIRYTFQQGVKQNADVLQLGKTLFKNNPKLWHRLYGKEGIELTERTLGNVTVDTKLYYSGVYKLQR